MKVFGIHNEKLENYDSISSCITKHIGCAMSDLWIAVSAQEIEKDLEAFVKLVFVSELFLIGGLNVIRIEGDGAKDAFEKKLLSVMDKSIYNGTSFEQMYESLSDWQSSYENRAEASVICNKQGRYDDSIRTIVIWNGKNVLSQEKKLTIEFVNTAMTATVRQIQKVILPDFSGSIFGKPQLETGEIGTAVFGLDKNFESFYFAENQRLGAFVLKEDYLTVGYGKIIE